jgi:hypothetical protein
MTLRDLSKPQSDAAHAAAHIMLNGDCNRPECRQAYADAVIELEQMLVEPAEARALIREAARWQMRDAIAEVCAGLPSQAVRA